MMTTKTGGINAFENKSDSEIKQLIEKYPYFQNLYHTLLENNIELEGTDIFQSILHQTSLHAVDRSFIFKKIRQLKSELQANRLDLMELAAQNNTLELLEDTDVEVLELESAKELEEEALAITPEPMSSSSKELEDDLDTDSEETFSLQADQLMPEEERTGGVSMLEKIIAHSSTEEPNNFELDDQRLDFLKSFSKALDSKTVILNPKNSKPKEKQVRGKDLELEITNKKPLAKENAFKKRKRVKKKALLKPADNQSTASVDQKVTQIVERSVMESEEVASETLAELLVTQEQYDKAIKMYERMQLLFPEKSTYFAEKIERILKL